MIDLDALDFARGGGLVTVVTQDVRTGVVLMLAHADREALERTLATGEMHYRSRTRGLWRKGETSGHTQRLVSLAADCDRDAVLARVLPAGPACHTGATSCFGERALAADALATLDAVIATAPGKGIAFESFDEPSLAATLREGRPVLLDFTADWCAPCHELERFTFSDRRVKAALQGYRAFRVDLTKYQSPDAERWRRRYGIAGVPTVVFLAPDGNEVAAARVEGFLRPEHFLERVRRADEARAAR